MAFLDFIPLVGTAVNAVGNLIGQKSANDANVQAVRETNQANRELAQYNWEQQVAMWNRQNEYNSPLAQMSRLKDAGLNPHLVYGNGVTGNTSGQAPTPQLAQMEAPRVEALRYGDAFQGIGDAMATYFNRKRLQNESELAESQVAAQSVENRLKLAQMISEFSRNRGLEIDNRTKQDLQKYIIKGAAESLIKQQNDNYMFDTQMHNLSLELELKRKALWMSQAQIENVVKQKDLISAQIASALSNVSLNSSKKAQLDKITSILGLDYDLKYATLDEQKKIIGEKLTDYILKNGMSAQQYRKFTYTGGATHGEVGAILDALYALGLNLGF